MWSRAGKLLILFALPANLVLEFHVGLSKNMTVSKYTPPQTIAACNNFQRPTGAGRRVHVGGPADGTHILVPRPKTRIRMVPVVFWGPRCADSSLGFCKGPYSDSLLHSRTTQTKAGFLFQEFYLYQNPLLCRFLIRNPIQNRRDPAK